MEPRHLRIGPNVWGVFTRDNQTPTQEFSAHEYILPLYLSLAVQERPEQEARLQRRYARILPLSGAAAMGSWLQNQGVQLDNQSLHRRLLNLSQENQPSLFAQDTLSVARDLKSQGEIPQAFVLYQFLKQWSDDEGMSGHFTTSQRQEILEEVALLSGNSEDLPLLRRVQHHFEIMDHFTLAEDVSVAGGSLGMATLAFSLFRPVRPLAALGIKFLSNPVVSASLITAGGIQLYHQFPMFQESMGRLLGKQLGPEGSGLQDALSVGSYLLHGMSLLIGVGSFGAGAQRFCQYRTWARSQGYTPAHASRVGYIYGDAARRAFEDPLVWSHWGGASMESVAWVRSLARFGGVWTHRTLLGGSALLGGGNLYLGLSHDANSPGGISFSDLMSRLAYLGLDVSPAVTMWLYRAGRGNRNFDLGPALSQDLTEAHYADSKLRARVMDRIENGLFALSPSEEWKFIQGGQRDLAQIRRQLSEAQNLKPLSPQLSTDPVGQTPFRNLPFPKPGRGLKFSTEALYPQWTGSRLSRHLAQASLRELRQHYNEGRVAPSGVLQLLWRHPSITNSSLFPRRIDQGMLREQLYQWARQSDRRFERGGPWVRPLEGVIVAVKDLFPGSDGVMMMGSKTSRMVGVGESPVVRRLRELGAIPIPVGMVAAANGGSGMHAGFGYISHPTRPGMDPAGSSSGTAHVVGSQEFPISIGIGTDTGGSVIAPAGAVGLQGWVPPRGFLSTKNMVPFDTNLDRVGVLSRHSEDALNLVRLLRQDVQGDPHLAPLKAFRERSGRNTQVVYLESLVRQSSPAAQQAFHRQLNQLREQGIEARALGSEWDFLSEVPLTLYPLDAYGAAAFTFTNPMRARLGDPPRRTLDHNLQIRLAKGHLAIKYNLFSEARELSQLYQREVRRLLGDDFVLAAPSPEAVPTVKVQDGSSGPLLDQHDRITMAKNRLPWWGQYHFAGRTPEGGVTLSGTMNQIESLVTRLQNPVQPPISNLPMERVALPMAAE